MKKVIQRYQTMSIQMKASLWFMVCGFLQKGVALLTTPIFTRIMTQREYGQFSVYLSWLGIFQIFITLNLSYGVYLQGLVKYEEDKERFTSSLLGLTTLLTIVFLGVYYLFQELLNVLIGFSTPIIICMIISSFAEAVFSFWSGKQRNEYKYAALVLVTMIVVLAKTILGIALIFAFPGYALEMRIFSITAVEIIIYLYIYLTMMKRGRCVYHRFYWQYALGYNIMLIPHYLSQTILSSSDRIMISAFCGEEQVAIYGLAYSLGMLMTIINTALSSTFTPWVYRQIKAKDYSKIGKYSYCLIGVVAAANLILIVFAPEIIAIFAPESYHEGVWLIPPIAMGSYFMFMYNIFANFAFYLERTKEIAMGSILGALLNVILNYLFIEKCGYVAAAYTTFVCYLLYAIGHYMFMKVTCRKKLGKNANHIYKPVVLICISMIFVLAAFTIMVFYQYKAIRYLLILSICVALVKWRMAIMKIVKQLSQQIKM